MPSWISKLGIWKPAKEKAYVPADEGKGRTEGYIYEGPDRAAKDVLARQGVPHLGMLSSEDPEVIMRARQLNMSVEAFIKMNEPPSAATQAQTQKTDAFVQQHRPEPRKPGVKPQGGRAPDRPESEGGGFGDAPDAPAPVSGQSAAPTG